VPDLAASQENRAGKRRSPAAGAGPWTIPQPFDGCKPAKTQDPGAVPALTVHPAFAALHHDATFLALARQAGVGAAAY
jgi:hypothetical protein